MSGGEEEEGIKRAGWRERLLRLAGEDEVKVSGGEEAGGSGGEGWRLFSLHSAGKLLCGNRGSCR